MNLRNFFSIFLVFLLFSGNLFAQNKGSNQAGKSKKNQAASAKNKTKITSKFIDIKRKTQKIEFIDDVVVRNGEDIMTSDRMVVFYKEKDKNSTNQDDKIERIDAYGNVKVFSSEFVASGDTGFYDPKNALFVLEKNVIVNNSDSIGTGEKFVYNLNTRQGKFVGDSGKIKSPNQDRRVVVIIGKDSSKNSKKKK